MKVKASYHVFSERYDEACMFRHFKTHTLITNACELAMEEAGHKLRELEIEMQAEFLFFTHMSLFAVHLTSAILLLNLLTAKRRLKKRMDRSKRRLNDELNDPFLRRVLEVKSPDGPNMIQTLETRVVNSRVSVSVSASTTTTRR